MNQKQREFLIRHIEKQHQAQEQRLKASKPTEPSMNNYIVAAILDGSFQLQDEGEIRQYVRQRALSLGPSQTLVDRKRGYGRDESDDFMIEFSAERIFVLPPDYVEALRLYREKLSAWEAESKHANEIKETLILKIQIGSDKVLAKLIEQADNLADLQIVNTRLLLTSGDD